MKVLLKYCFVFLITSIAFSLQSANAVIAPPGISVKLADLKIKNIVGWKIKDLQHAMGHKLTLKEKIAFTIYKHKMKKAAKQNPDLTLGEFLTTVNTKNKVGLILVIVLALAVILFLVLISSALPN